MKTKWTETVVYFLNWVDTRCNDTCFGDYLPYNLLSATVSMRQKTVFFMLYLEVLVTLYTVTPINKPFIKQCILILLFSQISFQVKHARLCAVWPHMLMKSKNLFHERWIRVLCCKWSVKHMWMMLRRRRGKEEREKKVMWRLRVDTHTHTQNVIEQAHNNNSHKLWSNRLHFFDNR